MSKFAERYQKIADKLIKKNFPALQNFKIFLTEKKIFKFRYSGITTYFIFFGLIIIHPKARKYPDSALYALLVHELAHLDIIVRKNFWGKIKLAFKWYFTKKGKIDFETEADTLTVEKGYGYGLVELGKIFSTQKDAIKNRSKHGYLTLKQIESLLKKSK